jgi:hypothetical protein
MSSEMIPQRESREAVQIAAALGACGGGFATAIVGTLVAGTPPLAALALGVAIGAACTLGGLIAWASVETRP